MTDLFNLILGLTITFIGFELMQYFGVSDYLNGWISCYVFGYAIQPYLRGRNDKRIKTSKVNTRASNIKHD